MKNSMQLIATLLVVFSLFGCSAKQKSIKGQDDTTVVSPTVTDITAPPVFEKSPERNVKQSDGKPVSYQEWLRQRQQEAQK